MAYVYSFRDLEVYKLSQELASSIFELTKRFPNTENYQDSDYLKERQFERSFDRFLVGTKSKTHFDFISRKKQSRNCAQCDAFYQLVYLNRRIDKMIANMIKKSSKFCK